MSNYTPLDISLMIRSRDRGLTKNRASGFDKLFFPFSIVVLIMSLSFYAVRLGIEILSPANTPIPEPTQTPQKTVEQMKKSAVPTIPVPQVYQDVNGILVDADKMLSTAKMQYPDLSQSELVEQVNKSIIQWAALRQYYKDNPNIATRLSVETSIPIATYSAILRDIGLLISEYDKDKASGKEPLDTMLQTFTANSKIR